MTNATKNIANPELVENEEDIISYCLFPEVSMEYFKWRAMPEDQRPKTPADIETEEFVKVTEQGVKAKTESKTDAMEQLLHNQDYQGMSILLEKASLLKLDELVIKKGDFNIAMKSGKNGAGSAVHAETMSNAQTAVQEEVTTTEKAVEKARKGPAV